MLAATKVKMSGSKKNEQAGHLRYFLHYKTCNKEVSRCSRAKQRQTLQMYKNVCCTCKVAFLLNRPIVVFSPFSFPLPLKAMLHGTICNDDF